MSSSIPVLSSVGDSSVSAAGDAVSDPAARRVRRNRPRQVRVVPANGQARSDTERAAVLTLIIDHVGHGGPS
ncbi:MAG: hypothetical protein WCF36_07890 [Candidatus Nanopelagicales bacterium]